MSWVFVAAQRLSGVAVSGNQFLIVVHGILIEVASLVAEDWL